MSISNNKLAPLEISKILGRELEFQEEALGDTIDSTPKCIISLLLMAVQIGMLITISEMNILTLAAVRDQL